MDTEWMSVGKCKDLSPTIFFPSDGVGVQAAQRICAECPVAERASSTRSTSGSTTGSGAASPSASAGGSCGAAGSVTPSSGLNA